MEYRIHNIVRNQIKYSIKDEQRAILRLSLADNTWLPAPTHLSRGSSISTVTTDTKANSSSNMRPTHKLITLWVHLEPGRLHLLSMDKQNPALQIREYVEKKFHLGVEDYTLASLIPGVSYPIPVMRFATDLNKGIVLCLPTSKIELNIHIQRMVNSDKGDKHKFKSMKIMVSPLQTIKDLKSYIQKTRGIPTSVQELVYNGHALQNPKLLLDYNLSSGTKLHLMLQAMKSFSIHCKTFWGKSYQMEASACTTVEELIDKVLLRTLSDNRSDADLESILGPRTMYKHLILVEYQEMVLDKQTCLNHFLISRDSCININAASEMRRDTHRQLQVAMDTSVFEVRCGTYDTWLMLALRLHGQTGIHLNHMQIMVNDKAVDLKNTIGSFRLEGNVIRLVRSASPDPTPPLILSIRFPSGHVETITCYHKALVKDLKMQIEARGFENAQMYDLLYKRMRLPSNSRLSDYKLPDRVTMEMSLAEFSISATHASNTARLMIQADQTLGSVLKKLEDRLGSSPVKHCVLHSGEDLYNYDTLKVSESFLHLNSHLYVEHLPPAAPVLHLVTGDDVIPITVKATMDSLPMHQLSSLAIDTSILMESLKWFIKWRFPDKSRIFSQTRQHSMMQTMIPRHHTFHGNSGRAASSSSSSSSCATQPQTSTNNDKYIMTSLHRAHSQQQARTGPSIRTSKFVVKPNEAKTSTSKSYNMLSGGVKLNYSPKAGRVASRNRSPKGLPHLSHSMETHSPSPSSAVPRRPAIKSSTPKALGYQVTPALGTMSGKDQYTHSAKKKLSVRFEIPPKEDEDNSRVIKIPFQTQDAMTVKPQHRNSNEPQQRSRSNTSDNRLFQGVQFPMNGLRSTQSSTLHRTKYINNMSAIQSAE